MSRPKQDEFTRYKRLSEARCPTHGYGLVQVGIDYEAEEDIVACPRRDCEFKYQVPKGSKTAAALRPPIK